MLLDRSNPSNRYRTLVARLLNKGVVNILSANRRIITCSGLDHVTIDIAGNVHLAAGLCNVATYIIYIDFTCALSNGAGVYCRRVNNTTIDLQGSGIYGTGDVCAALYCHFFAECACIDSCRIHCASHSRIITKSKRSSIQRTAILIKTTSNLKILAGRSDNAIILSQITRDLRGFKL